MISVLILQHAEGEWIGSMNGWFTHPSRVNNFTLKTIRLDHGETLPDLNSFDWLLIMGGPMSVNDETGYPWLIAEKRLINQAVNTGKTILGICLGGQLIAAATGAMVYPGDTVEIGWFPVIRTDTDVKWLSECVKLLSWHGDCFSLPKGAIPFATSSVTPYQGFSLGKRIWALQFHLEAQSGTVDDFLLQETQGLPEGRYIQTEQQLKDEAFLPQSRMIMHQLLDRL